ncbi:hypothetical protein M8J76_017174 [Diaphorina citri]|nr:hypothetical protein M8J75_008182 [Diaphorina citri]KAI5737828.1 hypothetical protein M8J76_017174 [Diaphorina citri]
MTGVKIDRVFVIHSFSKDLHQIAHSGTCDLLPRTESANAKICLYANCICMYKVLSTQHKNFPRGSRDSICIFHRGSKLPESPGLRPVSTMMNADADPTSTQSERGTI